MTLSNLHFYKPLGLLCGEWALGRLEWKQGGNQEAAATAQERGGGALTRVKAGRWREVAGMGDIFGAYISIEPTGLADLLNLGKEKGKDPYLYQTTMFISDFFPLWILDIFVVHLAL